MATFFDLRFSVPFKDRHERTTYGKELIITMLD